MRARNNFFLISRRSEYARKFAYVGRKPRPLKSIKESVVGKPVVKHLRKKLYCLLHWPPYLRWMSRPYWAPDIAGLTDKLGPYNSKSKLSLQASQVTWLVMVQNSVLQSSHKNTVQTGRISHYLPLEDYFTQCC